jgi:hypothetical protein
VGNGLLFCQFVTIGLGLGLDVRVLVVMICINQPIPTRQHECVEGWDGNKSRRRRAQQCALTGCNGAVRREGTQDGAMMKGHAASAMSRTRAHDLKKKGVENVGARMTMATVR